MIMFIAFTSCEKSVQKPSNAISATTTDQAVAAQSNLDLLCANTWKYNRYYTGYSDPQNPGTLVYQRGGGTYNTINLDLNRVTYSKDGTVDEIDQYGNHVSGTWYFTDATQTSYIVTNMYGSFPTNIMKLTDKKFIWNGSGVAAIMTPARN